MMLSKKSQIQKMQNSTTCDILAKANLVDRDQTRGGQGRLGMLTGTLGGCSGGEAGVLMELFYVLMEW